MSMWLLVDRLVAHGGQLADILGLAKKGPLLPLKADIRHCVEHVCFVP